MARLSPIDKIGCSSHIELLRDDKLWLKELLGRMLTTSQIGLLDQYKDKWIAALDKGDSENQARFIANTWIRKVVKNKREKELRF